jgi:hypothetical protein
MYKEEVKSLRSRLAPNVATITLLLVTQTLDTVAHTQTDSSSSARELNDKVSSGFNSITAPLKGPISHISHVIDSIALGQSRLEDAVSSQEQTLGSLNRKAEELSKSNTACEAYLDEQSTTLQDVQETCLAINSQGLETLSVVTSIQQDATVIRNMLPFVLGRALKLLQAVTFGISKMQDITRIMHRLIRLMSGFTIEIREIMQILLQEFWLIQKQLAKFEQLMHKWLSPPLVIFRDAFNEARVFPYDLSREWQTFQGLVAVAFTGKRGLHRVHLGKYSITNLRIGQRINPRFWRGAVEPNDELSMTMIFDHVQAEQGFCPYRSCGVSTKDVGIYGGGKVCSNCFRFAVISEQGNQSPILGSVHEHETSESKMGPFHQNSTLPTLMDVKMAWCIDVSLAQWFGKMKTSSSTSPSNKQSRLCLLVTLRQKQDLSKKIRIY